MPSFLTHYGRKLGALFAPNWCLAALVAIHGYVFLQPAWQQLIARDPAFWLNADNWQGASAITALLDVPRIVLGLGLQIMAIGLILKARIAWAFSLILLIGSTGYALLSRHGNPSLTSYAFFLIAALILYWRRFDRSSLAAGSLFALISIVSLLIYAVFGALYLGAEFNPPINDMASALYFSVVSMSTVGYGDITPHTNSARLFTASIIILGITVFATSISAVVGPIIGGNIKRLIKGRLSHAMRKHHIIIAGATPLALSVYQSLRRSGKEVTVIVPSDVPHEYPAQADVIIGDPSSAETLTQAGAAHAHYVLALRDDDAENAFIVLATKEITGSGSGGAKTVALVNTSKHLEKIKRVQPDMTLSLQLLGSELLTRTLNGEPLDSNTLTDLFFTNAQP